MNFMGETYFVKLVRQSIATKYCYLFIIVILSTILLYFCTFKYTRMVAHLRTESRRIRHHLKDLEVNNII